MCVLLGAHSFSFKQKEKVLRTEEKTLWPIFFIFFLCVSCDGVAGVSGVSAVGVKIVPGSCLAQVSVW